MSTKHIPQSIFDGLAKLISNSLEVDVSSLGPSTNLMELGGDSIVLMEISSDIGKQFGVIIPMRRLLEDLQSVQSLAEYIVAERESQDVADIRELVEVIDIESCLQKGHSDLFTKFISPSITDPQDIAGNQESSQVVDAVSKRNINQNDDDSDMAPIEMTMKKPNHSNQCDSQLDLVSHFAEQNRLLEEFIKRGVNEEGSQAIERSDSSVVQQPKKQEPK